MAVVEGRLLTSEMTLREVGRRMARLPAFATKHNIATEPLLSALKKGDLVGRVSYPSALVPEITVPTEHWNEVTHRRFKSIIHVKDRKDRTGTYSLTVDGLFQVYLDLAEMVPGITAAMLKKDVSRVVSAFGNSREATVAVAEWQSFLAKGEHVEPEPVSKASSKKGGRHPLAGWRDLTPFLILAFARANVETAQQKQLVSEALIAAEKAGKTELPSHGSVSKIVSDAVELLKSQKADS